MRNVRRTLALLSAGVFLCGLAAVAQDDSPSLGDVARQARLQKQKDAQAASSPTSQNQNSQNPAAGNQSPSAKDSAAGAQLSGGQNVPITASGENQSLVGSANPPGKNPGPKAKRVITDEELPEAIHPSAPSAPTAHNDDAASSQPEDGEQKLTAEQWKSQIQAMKSNIASLQKSIDDLSASIQFAPGNCVSGCVEWNEHQQQKQQQVETMKAQLAEQQKNLEDMQESARHQGYGSSVYDP